jgi:hypothetical protein
MPVHQKGADFRRQGGNLLSHQVRVVTVQSPYRADPELSFRVLGHAAHRLAFQVGNGQFGQLPRLPAVNAFINRSKPDFAVGMFVTTENVDV